MTPRTIPGPYDPAEMCCFLDTFLYDEAAFLIDEVTSLDAERHEIRARLDTTRSLPISRHQRVTWGHPGHISGGELVTVTIDQSYRHSLSGYMAGAGELRERGGRTRLSVLDVGGAS